MAELLPLVERYGLLIVIALYVTVKVAPAAIEKIWPEWMAQRREQLKARTEADIASRVELARLFERVIAVIEMNTRTMSGVAMSVNTFERALDANTQQLARITEISRRGPSCPLPDCPFMNKEQMANG